MSNEIIAYETPQRRRTLPLIITAIVAAAVGFVAGVVFVMMPSRTTGSITVSKPVVITPKINLPATARFEALVGQSKEQVLSDPALDSLERVIIPDNDRQIMIISDDRRRLALIFQKDRLVSAKEQPSTSNGWQTSKD